MKIGYRLSLVREKCGLTLDKVAAMFGISPQTLSRYENEKRTPDVEFLEAFGKKFNVSGSWLLYGEPPIFNKKNPEGDTAIPADKKDRFMALRGRIQAENKGEISGSGIVTVPLKGKMTEDTPESYLAMLEYMVKDPQVRENMFHFFYLFQKPVADKRG